MVIRHKLYECASHAAGRHSESGRSIVF